MSRNPPKFWTQAPPKRRERTKEIWSFSSNSEVVTQPSLSEPGALECEDENNQAEGDS